MASAFIENQNIAIINDEQDRARTLAQNIKLNLISHTPTSHPKDTLTNTPHFTLQWLQDKLTLQDRRKKQIINICVDFTHGRALHRLKFGGGHGQELARAIKTREQPTVCDGTAGLGKDAFVLASLGCEVTLLEQSKIVHALLDDAIKRARQHPETSAIAERMHLYHADSTQLPNNWPHSTAPQVVYLDPMYPDGKRTAKKEIQALRSLLKLSDKVINTAGQKSYEAALLEAARNTAKRVVIKRPRKAPPLANSTPSGNITSPNTRYDIYGA